MTNTNPISKEFVINNDGIFCGGCKFLQRPKCVAYLESLDYAHYYSKTGDLVQTRYIPCPACISKETRIYRHATEEEKSNTCKDLTSKN